MSAAPRPYNGPTFDEDPTEALVLAVVNGNPDTVEALLRAGADKDVMVDGKTLSEIVIAKREAYKSIATMLGLPALVSAPEPAVPAPAPYFPFRGTGAAVSDAVAESTVGRGDYGHMSAP
jgi:ankyrin repeat protein